MPCTTVRPSSDYSGYKASWQSAPQDQHRIRPGTPSCLCLPTLAPQVTCLPRTAPAILQPFAVQRLHLIATSQLWQPLSYGNLSVWCYMQRGCNKPIRLQCHFSETAYTCCIRKAITACQAHHWPYCGKTAHAASIL